MYTTLLQLGKCNVLIYALYSSCPLKNVITLAIYFFRYWIFDFIILDLSLMTYQRPSKFTEYMNLVQLKWKYICYSKHI